MTKRSLFISLIAFPLFVLSPYALAHPVSELISDLENRYGGQTGVAVQDTSDQSLWHYQGNSRFPLMSIFKTLACAKLLADIDRKKQKMTTEAMITRESLVPYSPVTEPLTGQTITLEQACEETMTTSDNTAANRVLAGLGGPQQMTDFLRSTGDTVTRLDRIEPELNEAKQRDLRDTTTPLAMTETLNHLILGDILYEASRVKLQKLMMGN